MPRIRKKHPLAIRWMHWINFPIIGVMIWSGLLIYWANDIYNIHVGRWELFHFFPKSFYNVVGIPHNLAKGMSYHFVFMWIFMLNGLVYVIYTAISGEWRFLVPGKGTLRHARQTILHDIYLRKEAPTPQKFNGAQQIAYTGIIIMGALSVLSGIAIYKPVQHHWATWLFGGYGNARVFHFILTMGYVLFFVVHIAQVIRAGWSNFQSMVTGFEKEKEQTIVITPPITQKQDEAS
jgi:thiosulfate reductase cytochrome b subunit